MTLQRLEGVWPYRDCWKFASKWRNVRFMKKNWDHQKSWEIMKIRSREDMKWEAIASLVTDRWYISDMTMALEM